ncbi:hypothetical protein HZS55_12065 [Halosimplex rubrum]|uniref:Uncharacterized protein n=1 Tax=Halosimplex rubrum TaxID=869889 RepID=A0A7D5T5U9_9EURY|nr:hypothetical protein [Halosimplex rubrum]QLH77989.1 hypothetical protein HZS55_12065 [Halosimplex rubrum]
MEKTVDVSGWPMRALRYALTGCYAFGTLFVLSFFLSSGLTALDVAIPYRDGPVWPAAFAVFWAVLTVECVRLFERADGDWWGPIPREQYLGRFAEAGGLARYSWEKAIDELPEGEGTDGEDTGRER